MSSREIPPLVEHKVAQVAESALTDEQGIALWERYRKQVNVEFPSPKTDGNWELKPNSWVGYIPLDSALTLELQPKIALGNLFRMLEYAYRIDKNSLKFPKGLIESDSLQDYFESLAHTLAKKVLYRARQGLYRTYLSQTRDLRYVRGRLDIRHHACAPWNINLRCHYADHTGDVAENQILAWTLFLVARSPLRDRQIAADVRRAYRSIVGVASLRPHDASACIGRLYHRLNEDYEPLHALCRFFLDHTGPSRNLGDRKMLPFLVDMARLFELFVAEWLTQNLPRPYEVRTQHKVTVDARSNLSFRIDLVLFDRELGDAVCVLDTKYKDHLQPNTTDFSQVVTYAVSQKCTRAALIYPQELPNAFHASIGEIDVRALPFPVGGDVQLAGETFMKGLLSWVRSF